MGWILFWRSSRDSNPGGTFMPYEISSHASSTSLSTPPYDLRIISAKQQKIKSQSFLFASSITIGIFSMILS